MLAKICYTVCIRLQRSSSKDACAYGRLSNFTAQRLGVLTDEIEANGKQDQTTNPDHSEVDSSGCSA